MMIAKRTRWMLLIALFIGAMALLSCVVLYCCKRATPESKFRALFTDLSIGVPHIQTLDSFSQPSDALKSDFCSVDFRQTDKQFAAFIAQLGVSQSNVLSSNGVAIVAKSKISPKYPWMLLVHAESTNVPEKIYSVHIDGRQPYN